MQGANVGFLVSYVGFLAIVAAFGVMTYRVGHFTVMPGEAREQVLFIVLALAIGLILGVAVPQWHWSSGSDASFIVVIAIGLGGLVLTRVWLRPWVTRIVQKQPPEKRAEIDRRTQFMRSHVGQRLFWLMLLSMTTWLFVANIATS